MTESLKHPNPCSTPEQGITLEQLVDEKLNVGRERLRSMDEAIILARGLLKDLMEGFPAQYVRKGDSDVALTEMKAQVTMVMNAMNKIDLGALVPKAEYNLQHKILNDKIEAAQGDIAEKTEMARKSIEDKTTALKDNADIKFQVLDKKVQDGELVRADIMGRIIGTGATLFVALAALNILLHYLWK